MTGRGRARGRIRSTADETNSPGGLREAHAENDVEKQANTQSKDNTESKATLSLEDIQSILQDSRTYSDQNDVKKVLMCAQNFVRSEDDVVKIAELIYNKCIEDSSLAKRGAEICDSLSNVEVSGTKFRNCLLSLVQKDYKARKDLRSLSPVHFNGFLAFLCEVFSIMRTTTKEVFKPLVPAIFDCFDLVLGKDGDEETPADREMAPVDEDACDVVHSELMSMGRLLQHNGEDRMTKLMEHIRFCIVHSKSSPRMRCCLLEVIEFNARNWEPASNDTTQFYCDMAMDIISGLVL